MYELIYVFYFTFISTLGHYLISKAFEDTNRKRVRFQRSVEVIYFDRIENKEEYWYNIDDFIRFQRSVEVIYFDRIENIDDFINLSKN
jgi:hypothetical protein